MKIATPSQCATGKRLTCMVRCLPVPGQADQVAGLYGGGQRCWLLHSEQVIDSGEQGSRVNGFFQEQGGAMPYCLFTVGIK